MSNSAQLFLPIMAGFGGTAATTAVFFKVSKNLCQEKTFLIFLPIFCIQKFYLEGWARRILNLSFSGQTLDLKIFSFINESVLKQGNILSQNRF